MIKKGIMVIGILLILFATSCGVHKIPESTLSEEKLDYNATLDESNGVIQKNYIEKDLDKNIFVRASIENPFENNMVPIYEVNYKIFQPEEIKTLFFQDMEVETIERNGYIVYKTDDKTLSVGKDLSYSVVWDSVLYGQFSDLEKDGEQETLPFCTMEEAYTEIKNVLYQIGIDEITIEKSYAINANDMKEKEATWADEPDFLKRVEGYDYPYKGVWNPDDGKYVFYIDVLKDKMPIYDNYYEDEDKNEIWGTSIQVDYTKKGIISLAITGALEIGNEIDKWNIVSPDIIIEKIKEKFDLIIVVDDIVITELKLMYLTTYGENGSLQIIPIWRVMAEQDMTVDSLMEEYNYYEMPENEREEMRKILEENLRENSTTKTYFYYNAKTGEEIIL